MGSHRVGHDEAMQQQQQAHYPPPPRVFSTKHLPNNMLQVVSDGLTEEQIGEEIKKKLCEKKELEGT